MKKKYLYLFPSVIGLLVLYVYPFLYSITHLTNHSEGALGIYIKTLTNKIFLLSLARSLWFLFIGTILALILSYFLSILLFWFKKYGEFILALFLIPTIITPSAISFFVKILFDHNGILNKLLYKNTQTTYNFLNTKFSVIIVVFLFIWRNLGYCILIIYSSIKMIPKEYFEHASLEGSSAFLLTKDVILPSISNSYFSLIIISILTFYTTFKDVLAVFGNYPNSNIYMLQHYMQNQFESSNFTLLSSASHIFILLVILIEIIFTSTSKKYLAEGI